MKSIIFVILFLCTSNKLFAQRAEELIFIENVGQIHDQNGKARKDIDFVLQGKGVSVFISANKISYQFANGNNLQRVEACLIGTNTKAKASFENKQVYYENHYHNSKLMGRAHSYKKIVYRNIYPHIDWVLKINDNNTFEYEYAVGALGDASKIKMEYKGAKQVQLQRNGDLVINTPLGNITEKAPQTYSKSGQHLASEYKLHGNKLSYYTEPHQGAIVIDPKVAWATYYGDTTMLVSTNTSGVNKVFYDNKNKLYIAGVTKDISNIATIGAYQSTLKASGLTHTQANAFYVKMDTNGNRLYATYYSADTLTNGTGIFVFENNIYLTGNDWSNRLATSGAQQTSFKPIFKSAPFLAQFDTTGLLNWCTYSGGNFKTSSGQNCFTDAKGDVYVFGSTDTLNSFIYTPGAFKTIQSDSFEAYIIKYSPSGKRIWGTFLGGKGNETLFDAVYMPNDGSGSIYVVGNTTSDTGIATPGAYQTTKKGTNDAMLVKFDTSGRRLWGTYIGGELIETAQGICQDGNKNIYVAGQSSSLTGIATVGAYQTAYGGGNTDMFLMKFNTSGNRIWGTYFGGNNSDGGNGLCNDQWGNLFICGSTRSTTNIADTAAFQKNYGGGSEDGFIAAFKPNGKKFWSSYYGGEGSDRLVHTVSDGKNIYLVGNTDSKTKNVATKSSLVDTNANGNLKGWIVKISEAQIGYTADTLDPVSIHEINFTAQNIKLYPNPNNGNFDFETTIKANEIANLSITDALGKIHWQQTILANNNGQIKEQINLELLAIGVYFFHCKIGEMDRVVKFVKE